MSGPPAPVPAPAAAPAAAREPARPVAVVWCRQVDNEAESPGYMTVPEAFAGYSETLEAIRAVGHLTINVADTTDYWDPDPTQSLAYYPNLFLYPAFDGQYTCLGRMFLSREDRPRLGMKTLVLPTSELLQGEGFGPAILHWYHSMGGPRRTGGRPAVPPEPRLYDLASEGFFFHLGATEPVLLIAATRWERTMEVILHLIRELPTSLVALSTVLAFPYFLPSAGGELKEIQRKLPVSLVLMRVPPSEAQGELHDRRVAGWASSGLTVHDLSAETLPGDSAKAAAASPLVVRYVRDREVDRLSELRSRVDFVELPGTRSHFTDPEFLDGRRRRKEAWRIGTAMENAALLLSRPRGKQLALDPESAKRAQEYLEVDRAKPAAPSAPSSAAAPAAAATPPAPAAPEGPESVPVPTRVAPGPSTPPTRVSWLAVPGSGDWTVLDERTIRRIVAEEMERRQGGDGSPQRWLAEEITRSIALGVASAREQLEGRFTPRLQAVEERVQRMGTISPEATRPGPRVEKAIQEAAERAERLVAETRQAIAAEFGARMDDLARSQAEARAALEQRLDALRPETRRELQEALGRHKTEQAEHLSALVKHEAEQLRAAAAIREEAIRAEAMTQLEVRLHELVEPIVRSAVAPERAELVESVRRIEAALAERTRRDDELASAAPPEPAPPSADPALRESVDSLRAEQADLLKRLGEVDGRTQILSERLVPLVRDTLVKVAELRKAAGMAPAAGAPAPSGEPSDAAAPVPDEAIERLRREIQRESERLSAETQVQINELRRHVETTLGHQSRVWLTLIQQLSQLTGDRLEVARRQAGAPWEEPPPGPPNEDPSGDSAPPPRSRRAKPSTEASESGP
jgi:hypothetical protein